jgi:hypothetical protein
MALLQPYKGVYYLWKYVPSQAASITFIILFFIVTTLHFWRIFKLKSWFCLALVIGCVCKISPSYVKANSGFLPFNLGEVIGFIARAAAYNDTSNLGLYLIQSIFLVIAPAFFAASIYMTLSRIIRCVKGEHLSLIRVDRLTKTFVIGDYLSLMMQGSASSLTSHPNLARIGEDIVVAGLFIQLVLLGLFFVTAIVFQIRLKKQPTRQSYTMDAPWKQTLYMIYVVSALIFARSIFRVVECIQGQDGYSLGHEWTLYVFDAVPMIVASFFFWAWYPGYIQTSTE